MEPLSVHTTREEIVSKLNELRSAGDITCAIALCKEAAESFPNDYFYPQFTSDLHFQINEYEEAAETLIDCLRKKLPAGPNERFTGFARRYNRLRRVLDKEQKHRWAGKILAEIRGGQLDEDTEIPCLQLIQPDLSRQVEISEAGQELVRLLSDNKHFNVFAKQSKELLAANPVDLEIVLDRHILDRRRSPETFQVDKQCSSLYEKLHGYDKALMIAEQLLLICLDPLVVSSVFRICRHLSDYGKAEQLLEEHPSLLKTEDFKVLYELVYYFEAQNSSEQAQTTLAKMEQLFVQSAPILQTVKNLYTRFGTVDDVVRVRHAIEQLQPEGSAEFRTEVEESEAAVPSEIHNLRARLEHQSRLAAISELTRGISHELEQPITNIRYTVQFYRKMLEDNYTQEALFSVFDSILEETERMGGLISRLSPLTSAKSVIETFDLVERIRRRVGAEEARLTKSQIAVTVSPEKAVLMHADPVRFDQLIGNLLLNGIDAIMEQKGERRAITIEVQDGEDSLRITFEDTGIGIPLKYKEKIFDPFFSTKAPGKGEGLGLFIVWNLLKMQGGTIALDPSYSAGARFLITLPKTTKSNKEV